MVMVTHPSWINRHLEKKIKEKEKEATFTTCKNPVLRKGTQVANQKIQEKVQILKVWHFVYESKFLAFSLSEEGRHEKLNCAPQWMLPRWGKNKRTRHSFGKSQERRKSSICTPAAHLLALMLTAWHGDKGRRLAMRRIVFFFQCALTGARTTKQTGSFCFSPSPAS